MKSEEFIKVTGDTKIFVRSWQNNTNPRAIVVIVPGFNSHGGYYGWVAERLLGKNIEVSVVDLRGRGKSSGAVMFTDVMGNVPLE